MLGKPSNQIHACGNLDSQSRQSVKVHLSDETLIDASEYLNAVYEDLTQINEILSFQDSSLIIEGTALFFNAFEVSSSLEPVYLQALVRVGMMHGLFDRSSAKTDEVIIDTFSVSQDYGLALAKSCDSSFEADDDYIT